MDLGWDKFMGRRSPEEEAAYHALVVRLQQRFPALTPISQAPPLLRANGIGVTVLGKRDADAETGTYVKTLACTLVWVPIFMLGSYRVADAADGGWHFLGREPMSGLAKAWNAIGIPTFYAAALLLDNL
jgi:hypothetical protein